MGLTDFLLRLSDIFLYLPQFPEILYQGDFKSIH